MCKCWCRRVWSMLGRRLLLNHHRANLSAKNIISTMRRPANIIWSTEAIFSDVQSRRWWAKILSLDWGSRHYAILNWIHPSKSFWINDKSSLLRLSEDVQLCEKHNNTNATDTEDMSPSYILVYILRHSLQHLLISPDGSSLQISSSYNFRQMLH